MANIFVLLLACLLPTPSGLRTAALVPEAQDRIRRSPKTTAADTSVAPASQGVPPASLAEAAAGEESSVARQVSSAAASATSSQHSAGSASASASAAARGPPFVKERFQAMLSMFRKISPKRCGTRLTSKVGVRASLLSSIGPQHWQVFEREDGRPAGVRTISPILKSRYNVPFGLHLLRIGEHKGPYRSLVNVANAINKAKIMSGWNPGRTPRVTFEFELGLDMRKCWGELEDLEGHPVCGEEVMKDLALKVSQMEQPKMDSAGQSGSTIITNLRNHIIKSSTREEYRLMAKTMPKIQESIEARYEKFGGCWSTGLAPFCGALVEPLAEGRSPQNPKENAIWLLTREIVLPGDEYKPINAKTSWFDLKGPYFKGWRDGKSKVSRELPFVGEMLGIKERTWEKKDEGFNTFFPDGLQLRGCGSRDAAIAMVGDSAMLRDNGMTDYSLFGKVYSQTNGTGFLEQGCICDKRTKPKFPIVLQIDEQPRLQESTFWAVGIIDYIEQKVNSEFIGAEFSTMKAPTEFAIHWADMFTHYFKLPPRSCKSTSSQEAVLGGEAQECESAAEDNQRGEVFKVGQPVMTLRHILKEGAVFGEYRNALFPAGGMGILTSLGGHLDRSNCTAKVYWDDNMFAREMPWESIVGVPPQLSN